MRNYRPNLYKRLVEESKNLFLSGYITAEKSFIQNCSKYCGIEKVVDLGAGYGRLLNLCIEIYPEYIGIELNKEMFLGLQETYVDNERTTLINSDITKLSNSLEMNGISKSNSLYLMAQNTLGTIEGDFQKMLQDLSLVLNEENTYLVLSVFKRDGLISKGIEMFNSMEEMVGKRVSTEIDIENGLFVSNTGYSAKWWNAEELGSIFEVLNADIKMYKDFPFYSFYLLQKKLGND